MLDAEVLVQMTKNLLNQKEEHDHASHTQQADIQEKTKGVDTLPTFLDKLDPQMKDIYTVAGQNAELLDWIPCYCGCGESVGHKNNKNCFIREIKRMVKLFGILMQRLASIA